MQLVELQRNVHEKKAGEVAVYAISYDPVEVLARFAEEHGITYPLLADVGSKAITDLGLLNTQIVEERAYWGKPVEERHRGLPYPGTFVLDESGLVVDKVFERSHRIRPGGKVLLDRLGVGDIAAEKVVTVHGQGLSVVAWVDEPRYFPNQLNRLTARLAVEEGFHLYVPPNPSGFTNLTVGITGPDGVFTHDPEIPAGHSFRVEGFDEEFTVVEGTLEVVVPFYVLEDTGSFDLGVEIGYQACSESVCLPPDSVSLSLPLEETRV